jgi:hypothetical protein
VNEKLRAFRRVLGNGLTATRSADSGSERNLVLRADVIKAVAGGTDIYPVHSIDEGIEILAGARGTIGDEVR